MSTTAAQPLHPDEIARFRARPDCPGAITRFALHVQQRDPTSIWAPMTLAAHSGLPDERLYYLQQAVRCGERLWNPILQEREVRWWDERETRLFMAVIYALGHQSAVRGFVDTATECVRRLLTMDPKDRLGAEAMARETGIIPEMDAERASSMRM